MTSVLLTWGVLGCAMVGLGLAVQRLFGVRGASTDRCLVAFWMGFAVLVIVVQIWALVLPLTWHAMALLTALGVGGLVWNGADLAALARRLVGQRRVAGGIILLWAIWLANQAIGPGDSFDSGLYHFSTIEWANAYPAVPGLANMTGYLGVNSASLLYTAALDTGPWDGRAEHIANGLLLLAFAIQIAVSMRRLVRREVRAAPVDIFNVSLSALAIMLMFSKEVRSPRTDLPAAIVICVTGAWLVSLLSGPEPRPREDAWRIVCLCALCALTVCLKLTAIVWCFAVLVVVAIVVILRYQHRYTLTWRPLVWSASLALLLLAPWAGRSVILSGYPFFPFAALPAPVEWRLDELAVEGFADNTRIHSQSRLPAAAIVAASHVLPDWYEALADLSSDSRSARIRRLFLSLPITGLIEVVVPIMISVLVLCAIPFIAAAARARVRIGLPALVLGPAVVTILFWCATSPEPRFIYGATWVLAASTLTVACAPLLNRESEWNGRGLLVVVALLCVASVGRRAAILMWNYDTNPLQEIPFLAAGPDHGFHPLPTVDYQTLVNWSGLEYIAPAEDQFCWRCPLPCVVWPGDVVRHGLRLRREGDLSGGFVMGDAPGQ